MAKSRKYNLAEGLLLLTIDFDTYAVTSNYTV